MVDVARRASSSSVFASGTAVILAGGAKSRAIPPSLRPRTPPLVSEPSLKAYHLLPAVRGDLLRKLGRFADASAEFARAASLTQNVRERELLQRRAAECAAEGMAG